MPICSDTTTLSKKNYQHQHSSSLPFAFLPTLPWMLLMASKHEEPKVVHLSVNYLIMDVIHFHWHSLCSAFVKQLALKRMKFFWFLSSLNLHFGHRTGHNITQESSELKSGNSASLKDSILLFLYTSLQAYLAKVCGNSQQLIFYLKASISSKTNIHSLIMFSPKKLAK